MTQNVNTVNMSVYDLEDRLISGFSSIGVFFNATSISGTFTEVTTSATRLKLLSTDEYYTYTETGTDISDYYYKFKLFNGATSASSFQTSAFKAGTSDLTQDLRYMVDDTADSISDYRYTMKELRRFVKIALWGLQSTAYRYRFKADADGIINPSINNMDKGVILLQAQIDIAKSQLLKAADTNVMFKDGRGTFNNRSSEALRDMIKMLKTERNELIAAYNRVGGNETARMDMWSEFSGVSR